MTIDLPTLARLVRYYILLSSTAAGSGHATSSLSATELLTTLFFKHFHCDLDDPDHLANDRLVFSKGHATPLLYALYAAAGKITPTELKKYRTFKSPLEGHPSKRFRYTEVPTGSLGQGLSVGMGLALAQRKQVKPAPRTYVLLGDGEMAEGQVWEAIQTAAYYKLDNLIGIVDVNRLGQSGETMLGHASETYAERVRSFGWEVIHLTDGHDITQIDAAFDRAYRHTSKPIMIIAKTIKGKGISFLEDAEGRHGTALNEEEYQKALQELGTVDTHLIGKVRSPEVATIQKEVVGKAALPYTVYTKDEMEASRKAFGKAIVRLGSIYSDVVILDGDVKNSTYTELFQKAYPKRFFELFIAEQNMVSVAAGMARLGLRPFVSSFACFLLRAADQIRMAHLGQLPIVYNGSHAGVSIGQDGPSQMGLEDVSFFRTLPNSIVVQGSDAVATERLTEAAYKAKQMVYIRTARPKTPILYDSNETFPIGKSKTLMSSANDSVTVVASGVTVFEALAAAKQLQETGTAVRVIDCYSIQPIDRETLKKAAAETKAIITVEDHYAVGGLGDAVLEALASEQRVPVYKLAVTKTPRSGKPAELLEYEEIAAKKIVEQVMQLS